MKLKDMAIVKDYGGLKATSRLWRFSILLIFLGLIIYIIGFSTDFWGVLEVDDFEVVPGSSIDAHYGLWRKCEKLIIRANGMVIKDGCEDMDNDDDYKPASKALCSIGLILCIAALAVSILAGCRQKPSIMAAGGALTIFAALVAAIGSTIYIAKAKDDEDRLDPDYSVYFAIIGCVVLILGGGLELVSIRSGYTTIA